MKLDERTRRLIAVGASVTANCQPCLEHNLVKALESGADHQQLAETIKIAKMVRQGAITKVDEFILSLNNAVPSAENATDGGCGCTSVATQRANVVSANSI